MTANRTATHWLPGLGRQLWWMGGFVLYKAVWADTAEAYAIAWFAVMPGQGARPRIQSREGAGYYILEGELEFKTGNQTHRLAKGGYLHICRGTPFSFSNVSDRPAQLLHLSAPAGFDRFQIDSGKLIADDAATLPLTVQADMGKLQELAPQFGVEMEPPESAFQVDPQIKLTPPGEGPAYSVVGDVYSIKATGADTGGACAVFEFLIPPGGGPPKHLHQREDEGFFILQGELTFFVGDDEYKAPNGSFVNAPRGLAHRFSNQGKTPARCLCIAAPSGLENFFMEVGRPLPNAAAAPFPVSDADVAKLLDAAPKYGLEIHKK